MPTSPEQPQAVPEGDRNAAPENSIRDIVSDGQNAALENCIRDIASGDREALGRLYRETHAAVYAFALSFVQDRHDAEDVLQDVYVRIWQSAPSYRPMGKPQAWIYTIARNLALMEIRRKTRIVPVSPGDWQEIFSECPAVDAEDAQVLASVMGLLDEDERRIVLLHAAAGFKHRESAELLGLGLSTVLSKYSRALKKLRQALEVQ